MIWAGKQVRLRHLEELMAATDLWDDQTRAAEILKERGALLQALAEWTQKEGQVEDLEVLLDLAVEEEDHQAFKEVAGELAELEETFRDWELKLLLGAEEDQLNAIVTIHAGAGGTEAQDWTEILLRMYLRYAERHGFKSETIDLLPGDEAGVKSVTFTVSGPYAFGYLKAETGIHRLVRISPFDAQRPAPHLLCCGAGAAGGGRPHPGRYPGKRSAHRHLPGQRPRRPARQQDFVGGPPHPRAHEHRGLVPDGALPAPQ